MKIITTKVRSIAYDREPRESQLFWGMMGFLIVLILLYGFFIQGTIRNVVIRTNSEEKISELMSSLSVLESEHGDIKNMITELYARSAGYEEPIRKIYVSRKALAQSGGSMF